MLRKLLLVGAATAVACSSSTNTPGTDSALDASDSSTDIGMPDRGGDGPADQLAPDEDLSPDGPKVPARWEKIPDAPQVEGHHVVALADGGALIVGGWRSIDSSYDYEWVNQAWLFDPASNSFSTAGELSIGRDYHTATLLADGRVLVAGGQSGDFYDYEETTELFDPSAPAGAQWSMGPPMYGPRLAHAAVLLEDGRVLITGGYAGEDSTQAVLLFDPQQDSWIQPGAAMNHARRLHGMVRLANGKVLIAGGVSGERNVPGGQLNYLDSLEIYDPTIGTFTLLTVKMSRKRSYPVLVRLGDGRVLIVGGACVKDCGNVTPGHDIYDPVSDTIQPIMHPGPYPSGGFNAVSLNGDVLVIGGHDTPTKVHLFSAGAWKPAPDLLFVQDGEAVTLADGTVLLVGGATNRSPETIYAAEAQRFYP